MKMPEIKVGVGGKYRIEKWQGDTCTYQGDWFDNLITNNGLDILGLNYGDLLNNVLFYCYVGTGSTAPTVTDTTLTTYLATSSVGGGATPTFVSGTPSYYTRTFSWTFPVGGATGTLAEVGCGSSPGATPSMFSHALIVDSFGAPTTITVLSSESLIVYYQLQLYNDTTTNSYSVVISGVTYTGTYLLAMYGTVGGLSGFEYLPAKAASPNNNNGFPQVTVFNGSIGIISGKPSGTQAPWNGTVSMSTYATGSYTVTYTFNFPVSEGNVSGGISALIFAYAWADYQFSVSPAIPKDSSHIMTLVFSISWARYP